MRPSVVGSGSHRAKKPIRTAVIASLAVLLVMCVLAFALAGCTAVTGGGTTSTAPATTASTAGANTTGSRATTATIGGAVPTLPATVDGVALASPATSVATQLGPSVVNIKVTANVQGGGFSRGRSSSYSAEGSGVIYTSDGMIITNDHVVTVDTTGQLVDSVQVTLATGQVLPAKIVGHDPLTDLAVVKVTSSKPLPAATFDTSQAIVGDYAIAIGSPLGFANSVTFGIVSGLNRSLDQLTGSAAGAYIDLIQTDAAISPGNSGGALADAAGRVIGINVAYAPPSSTGAENLGFAIPALLATNIADQIIKTGKASHVYLGVSTQTVTTDLQTQFSLSRSTGALIAQVSANSPASKAGLKQGDIIIKIDSKDVTNDSDLLVALRSHAPGDTVQVTVDRNGSTLTIPVVVLERPAGT
jgi:S1-C subfamily serine protease